LTVYEVSIEPPHFIIEPLLPNKPRGVARADDRMVLNGIYWRLRTGSPWADIPERYGPSTTCYNRFVRWRKIGVWDRIFDAVSKAYDGDIQMVDSTTIRVHQQGANGKKGGASRRSPPLGTPLMHKELVEERRWIGEQRFLHALNYCMLLPGPEAQQLAIYIGWLMHRTPGGLVAGILFVLPGAFVMLGLSILYALYRSVPVIEVVFFGVKAAVLAVVVDAVLRIGRRALKNRIMVAIAVAAFLGIFVFSIPFPLIILAAGLIGWIGSRLAPGLFVAGGHGSKGGAADVKGVIDLMFERGELAMPTRPWPAHSASSSSGCRSGSLPSSCCGS
jgi:chromate transport protein ChrA/transposase